MTPEERAVVNAARKWAKRSDDARAEQLRLAVQALKISTQPLHTVSPIPCMKYSPNSAGMFCVLPIGHDSEEIERYRAEFPSWGLNVPSVHQGYPGGARGTGPSGGARTFTYWPNRDTMEGHDRPACARFPGCERHP